MGSSKLHVVGFAAFSGTGKTTLASQVISILNDKGYRVGVIKHAHHSFTVDTPGKDSHELRQAGAEQVLVASRQRVAWVMERAGTEEPELNELLDYFSVFPPDIVIVEGLKFAPFPKIEVHRTGLRHKLLASKDKNVIAVATDTPEDLEVDVPELDINDPEAIAEFIVSCMNSGMLARN